MADKTPWILSAVLGIGLAVVVADDLGLRSEVEALEVENSLLRDKDASREQRRARQRDGGGGPDGRSSASDEPGAKDSPDMKRPSGLEAGRGPSMRALPGGPGRLGLVPATQAGRGNRQDRAQKLATEAVHDFAEEANLDEATAVRLDDVIGEGLEALSELRDAARAGEEDLDVLDAEMDEVRLAVHEEIVSIVGTEEEAESLLTALPGQLQLR